MAQSMVCGGCGSAVPYGRLACPECGEMLASVVGVGRSTAMTATRVGSGRSDGAGDGQGSAATAPAPAASTADPLPSAADPLPPVAAPLAGPSTADGPRLALDDRTPPTAGATTSGPSMGPAIGAAAASMPVAPPTSPSWTAAPGAYVPPVLQPAGPAAPARTWAGYRPATLDDPGGTAASVDPGADESGVTGRLDVAKATEFVGWLAIAGGMFATVGFLLPWSVTVIGSGGVGYLDRWGLAGPGHLLVVAAILGVVAAAALRERVPLWLGVGLPGLALGALLLGLVWPYLIGPLGAQLGVTAVTVGAAMLAAAGVGAIVVDRHARGVRVV